jgi:hypothetical protein
MSAAKSGECAICGCTHFNPCPEGFAWANADQTLCDNSICVAVAKRKQKLLQAIVEVLDEVHDGAHTKSMKRLAKVSAAIPIIDLRKSKLRFMLPARRTGGAA